MRPNLQQILRPLDEWVNLLGLQQPKQAPVFCPTGMPGSTLSSAYLSPKSIAIEGRLVRRTAFDPNPRSRSYLSASLRRRIFVNGSAMSANHLTSLARSSKNSCMKLISHSKQESFISMACGRRVNGSRHVACGHHGCHGREGWSHDTHSRAMIGNSQCQTRPVRSQRPAIYIYDSSDSNKGF
jgi:hypothetical protein